MQGAFKLLCVFGIFLPYAASRHAPFFRKDYTYIEEFDAHYKVHWDIFGLSWQSAFLSCDDEGATLFYPKYKAEWTVVKNLTDELLEPPNVTDVFIGVHDRFHVGEFVSVDGHSTPYPMLTEEPNSEYAFPGGNCLVMNINTGAYKIHSCINEPEVLLPFVCKRVDDKPCPTIDREYKYIESAKKCYKVNRRLKTWDQAVHTCYMEGGLLAILEDREKARPLDDTLKRDTHYFIGIRKAPLTNDYYSIKGKKLDNFNAESNDNNQYNERVNMPDECGTLKENLETSSNYCNSKLPFICEMDATI